MAENVFVTGATGFIGRHLVHALKDRGYQVRGYGSADGDIASCALSFADVRHVFHLAALSFVPDSWDRPGDYYRANLLGTINVLEGCRSGRVPLTFVSSYVYGHPIALPIDESHPVRAINPYSHSKILAEDTINYYSRQFGIRAAIVRSFNTYGAGQHAKFLIPGLMAQALDPAGGEIVVADDRPRRDFLYVADLVDLLIASMEQNAQGIYNAGSGISSSIPDIVAILRSLGLADKPLRSQGKPRAEEVLDVVADISKARRELGWTPRTSLRDGLAKMLESVRDDRSLASE
jgi:nucleoside-diphosphate-sugar epimerase